MVIAAIMVVTTASVHFKCFMPRMAYSLGSKWLTTSTSSFSSLTRLRTRVCGGRRRGVHAVRSPRRCASEDRGAAPFRAPQAGPEPEPVQQDSFDGPSQTLARLHGSGATGVRADLRY